jgi:hypothetical protein
MSRPVPLLLALLLAYAAAAPALADDASADADARVARLEAQVAALTAKVEALEARVQELEGRPAPEAAAATKPEDALVAADVVGYWTFDRKAALEQLASHFGPGADPESNPMVQLMHDAITEMTVELDVQQDGHFLLQGKVMGIEQDMTGTWRLKGQHLALEPGAGLGSMPMGPILATLAEGRLRLALGGLPYALPLRRPGGSDATAEPPAPDPTGHWRLDVAGLRDAVASAREHGDAQAGALDGLEQMLAEGMEMAIDLRTNGTFAASGTIGTAKHTEIGTWRQDGAHVTLRATIRVATSGPTTTNARLQGDVLLLLDPTLPVGLPFRRQPGN